MHTSSSSGDKNVFFCSIKAKKKDSKLLCTCKVPSHSITLEKKTFLNKFGTQKMSF